MNAKSKRQNQKVIKRTKAQIENDRLVIEELYFIKGWTQREIQEKLDEERPYSLTQQQISKDVQMVMKSKKKELERSASEWLLVQLRKLEYIEKEYWETWDKSKANSKVGNTKILQGVSSIVSMRIKLLLENSSLFKELEPESAKSYDVYDLGPMGVIKFPR